MITCCWRPTPASESSSWMSSSLQTAPFIEYSLSPVRNSVRVIVTSAMSTGSRREELSIVSDTSARPSAGRFAVPAKMTSSIFDERTTLGPCAPSTQATASTTLDFPEPFGPTMTVTPGSNSRVVESAKDLKPRRVSDLRYTVRVTVPGSSRVRGDPSGHCEAAELSAGRTRSSRRSLLRNGPFAPAPHSGSTARRRGRRPRDGPGTNRRCP